MRSEARNELFLKIAEMGDIAHSNSNPESAEDREVLEQIEKCYDAIEANYFPDHRKERLEDESEDSDY